MSTPAYIIDKKFKLVRNIGSGSFGVIYLGYHIKTHEQVAVKLEKKSSPYPQILYESRIYRFLQGGKGVANLRWCGSDKYYNIMVIDLLGPSLEELFNFCSRRFTMKTVLMLADQMISRVEFLHSKYFVHRDLKPENFTVGLRGLSSRVYLIDFGLAKRYHDFHTGKHFCYRDEQSLTGTVRYASLNAHMGIEQSRRDDLESLGHIFIYFLVGTLPWQGVKGKTRYQKQEKITEMKSSIKIEKLCEGLPYEFLMYMKYCRDLEFNVAPHYMYLRQIFRILFRSMNLEYDSEFDWITRKKKIGTFQRFTVPQDS